LSLGAVDFGIIVDSAVILVENIFRIFHSQADERQRILHELGAGHYGPDPTTTKEDTEEHGWTERLRL
ncbi:hypothetical protein, partial [Proteus vulgaris]|uniref:hypothetical protein n=1 Tax=Proteus vulgaris TaxID=585 RepID=UPI0013D167D1